MKQIVVITEQSDDKPHPMIGEMAAAARCLADMTGHEIVRICMRDDGLPDVACQKRALIALFTGETLLRNEHEITYPFSPSPFMERGAGGEVDGQVISGRFLREEALSGGEVIEPAFIIMGHTVQGMELAPRLAVALHADCISGVHEIRNHLGQPAWVRSLFKGKANCIWVQKSDLPARPVVFTVQPGAFRNDGDDGSDGDNGNNGNDGNDGNDGNRVMNMAWEGLPCLEVDPSQFRLRDESRIQYGERIQNDRGTSTLGDARIIVSAGRGIESRENLEKIQQLADGFQNASVAGSRPLIDMGWMPYARQVGITGAVVAPDLYLAVGISGSSQHLAGMTQSKFIVAVNKDPNAAIFNVADVCIVADAPAFIETMAEKMKSNGLEGGLSSA